VTGSDVSHGARAVQPVGNAWITKTILVAATLVTAAVGWIPHLSDYIFEHGGRCAFTELTGWSCPFCGMTHATVAFLHADIASGIAANPFALLYLVGLAAGLKTAFRTANEPAAWWTLALRVVTTLAVLSFAVYWIGRNLWG
jgi:Protein of unknown function (DUF2752)